MVSGARCPSWSDLLKRWSERRAAAQKGQFFLKYKGEFLDILWGSFVALMSLFMQGFEGWFVCLESKYEAYKAWQGNLEVKLKSWKSDYMLERANLSLYRPYLRSEPEYKLERTNFGPKKADFGPESADSGSAK